MRRTVINAVLALLCLLLACGPAWTSGARADWEEPETSFPEGAEPLQGRYRPLAPKASTAVSPEQVGRHDTYGYTLSQPALEWVSAGSLNKAGGFNNPDRSYSDAIPIGFQFPFYEYSFSKIYINTDGFITFDEKATTPLANELIPQETPPNNLLAVFWDDLTLDAGDAGEPGPCGSAVDGIYYQVLGTGENQRLVVEWRQVCHKRSGSLLTFEAILYKNGDIRFQYSNLPEGLSSATVGIENREGTDGLVHQHNTAGVKSGSALVFTRPEAGPRGLISPRYLSGFTRAGQVELAFSIKNTGNQTDTYDFIVQINGDAADGWRALIYNGSMKLADTNGNGIPDSGPIIQGGTGQFLIQMTAPGNAGVGETAGLNLLARSQRSGKTVTSVTAQAAVPAPFAQAYSHSQSGLRMSLIAPAETKELETGNGWFSGNSLALATTVEANQIYAWEQSRLDHHNIGFTVLSPDGRRLVDPQDLTPPHPEGSRLVTDYNPVLVTSPGGNIGFAWLRLEREAGKERTNLFFSVLDGQGEFRTNPIQVTKNDLLRNPENDLWRFYSPKMAALDDGSFVLAWIDHRQQGAQETNDIHYALIKDGSLLKEEKLTDSVSGGVQYIDPSLVDVEGNRFLVAYSEYSGSSQAYTIAYQVLDRQGQTVKSRTSLGVNGSGTDAVRLKGGNILLAWTNQEGSTIGYSVLDGKGFNPAHPPKTLLNPDGRLADYVSVTRDGQGHGILTWMDAVWQDYLYYSLVDQDGTLLTSPMYFYWGGPDDPVIVTSYTGQGNAPFSPYWKAFLPLLGR